MIIYRMVFQNQLLLQWKKDFKNGSYVLCGLYGNISSVFQNNGTGDKKTQPIAGDTIPSAESAFKHKGKILRRNTAAGIGY